MPMARPQVDDPVPPVPMHGGPVIAPRRGTWYPYLLISPLLIFIIVLSLYPTFLTLTQSFYLLDPLVGPPHFIGLSNYVQLFTNPLVWGAWANTAAYVVIGVVLSTIMGVIMALALVHPFRGRAVVMAVMILPWALPGVVEGVIWQWIYDPNFGVLNSLLHSAHLIGSYETWIGLNRMLTIFLIELVEVWQMTPLAAILILASLQTIPNELYDAATVDGASRGRGFFRITLPLIRPGLAIAVAELMIASLNMFAKVYVLNGSASTGMSIMLQTYTITFQGLNFGQGYALSFIVTAVTMVLSLAILKGIYRKVEY
jgi:multiple sugar transport system permease protein